MKTQTDKDSMLDKDFNIPFSKGIYQKTQTDKDSMLDKDFNVPFSKDIYKTHITDKESLFEKDFNIPVSKDILRKSEKEISFKNINPNSNLVSREDMFSIKSVENDFTTVNEEYSMDELMGIEYSIYLQNTYKELGTKMFEMENLYSIKIQKLKNDIEV